MNRKKPNDELAKQLAASRMGKAMMDALIRVTNAIEDAARVHERLSLPVAMRKEFCGIMAEQLRNMADKLEKVGS